MKNKIYAVITFFFVIIILIFTVGKNKNGIIDFRDAGIVKKMKPVLIAHRGGVISSDSPECSLAAIQLAKKQEYQMVELDIRISRDRVPVVFHDSNMKKSCGINKRIQDLNIDEIVKVEYLNTDEKIITLDEALRFCHSLNLGVMLDVKVKDDEQLLLMIVDLIKKNGLEDSCITISGAQVVRILFKDTILLTVTDDDINKLRQGIPCDLRNKFWFGLPDELTNEMVKMLQENGAYVIPAINTFRYPKEGHYELARKDIQRLSKAGVDGYQIDSVYRAIFLELNL